MPSLGFRMLALVTSLAALALVAVGGMVRMTESGLGCPDWPLCQGNVVPAERRAPLIEYSHRATATVVTLLVVAAAVWAWRRYRRSRPDLVAAAINGTLEILHVAGAGAVTALLVALVATVGLPRRPRLLSERPLPSPV